jgi:hypothetical protein
MSEEIQKVKEQAGPFRDGILSSSSTHMETQRLIENQDQLEMQNSLVKSSREKRWLEEWVIRMQLHSIIK